MTASHYYITCGITDGDTGEHTLATAMLIVKAETLVFYIHPGGRPDMTHIVTARHDDAPVTRSLLDRLGIPLPPASARDAATG